MISLDDYRPVLKGKKLLLGVSSGIAIYKVLDLISRLKKMDVEIDVIMTPNASKMISPQVFQTMARSKVYVNMFETRDNPEVSHIALAERSDFALLAPATANTIGKLANGIADNLLTTTFLANKSPSAIAITMNTNMLENPATQYNLEVLKNRGYSLIESNSGFLACNQVGSGRMAEPAEIIDYLEFFMTKKDLKGRKILVTAGPTRERIDPVRYISNDSSGKMGYSIARAARNRGAEVTLVSGPSDLRQINNISTHYVESADEMLQACQGLFKLSDALIMTAAVGDFKVEENKEKIKKEGLDQLELIKNPDIIKTLGREKGDRMVIGFAAETEDIISNAKAKLKNKNADYIIANDVSGPDSAFNSDTNKAFIISKDALVETERMSKFDLANKALDLLKEW